MKLRNLSLKTVNVLSTFYKQVKYSRLSSKLIFFVAGFISTIWFLVRVIPKPGRAAYPCMRAAAPVASSFVLYILGWAGSIMLFRKGKSLISHSRYFAGLAVFIAALAMGIISEATHQEKAYALTSAADNLPNAPIGIGKGIFPGRVVWIHNPDATNENYAPFVNNYWMDDPNTNRQVVEKMVSDALQTITGTNLDENAWNKIFRYHNINHGKGDMGYSAGEKIVIKVNLNSNLSKYGTHQYTRSKKENIDTSPQIILAVLSQLVNKAGVAQADISIGDPGRNYDDIYYAKCIKEFPDVHYWGEGNGRTPPVKTAEKVIFASDGGGSDQLPQCYVDASYMINIPVFKKHHRAGISLSSKNHFGNFVTSATDASRWHYSLPAPDGKADVRNPGYGLYRCFVDIMGHKHLGDKTILYLFDALWSSTNNANPPIKWRLAPFNNDYPSSVFASLDPVAIESVGYDFLFAEFGTDHPTEGAWDPMDNKGPFPHYSGVDDFLHQAADSLNWPKNIKYDPEKDGTPLPGSLGVHEHWNNNTEKKYSRNLGAATGIELVYLKSSIDITGVATSTLRSFQLKQNNPNPFNDHTTIEFNLMERSHVQLSVYNVSGQLVRTLMVGEYPPGVHTATWDGTLFPGQAAVPGLYFYTLKAGNSVETKKMKLNR
jgi:hypothetical protein